MAAFVGDAQSPCAAGFYVEPMSCTSKLPGSSGDQTVLRMAGLPRCGLLRVEATKGALLSPEPRAVLVLTNAAAVAELRQLEAAMTAGTTERNGCRKHAGSLQLQGSVELEYHCIEQDAERPGVLLLEPRQCTNFTPAVQ